MLVLDDPHTRDLRNTDLATVGKGDPEYAGLGLVPGLSFFPHYSSRFAGLVDSKKGGLDHDVVTLDDSQAYLVDGEHRELISG